MKTFLKCFFEIYYLDFLLKLLLFKHRSISRLGLIVLFSALSHGSFGDSILLIALLFDQVRFLWRWLVQLIPVHMQKVEVPLRLLDVLGLLSEQFHSFFQLLRCALELCLQFLVFFDRDLICDDARLD